MLGDSVAYALRMECLSPVLQDQTIFGTRTLFERRCGYCEACRMTYRQSWSARIQLEAACHEASCFFTLTYSQDFLPDPPQLVTKHLQDFMKRLRWKLLPMKIRFFACGEYGSRSLRPHYHGVLFGVPCSLQIEKIILEAWGMGHIQVAPLSPARAAYVAKYVCKEVSGDDPIPAGWQKEFARMSNKPGIGSLYVDNMAWAINNANQKQKLAGYPLLTELLGGSMRIGPVYYPVARYLRDKLKTAVREGHRKDLTKALERERKLLSEPREVRDLKRSRKVSRDGARQRIRKSQGVL